jgi:hypothetical protein
MCRIPEHDVFVESVGSFSYLSNAARLHPQAYLGRPVGIEP